MRSWVSNILLGNSVTLYTLLHHCSDRPVSVIVLYRLKHPEGWCQWTEHNTFMFTNLAALTLQREAFSELFWWTVHNLLGFWLLIIKQWLLLMQWVMKSSTKSFLFIANHLKRHEKSQNDTWCLTYSLLCPIVSFISLIPVTFCPQFKHDALIWILHSYFGCPAHLK